MLYSHIKTLILIITGVGALIISPTRELAQQIALVLQPLADAHGFSSQTFIGGTKLKDEELKEGNGPIKVKVSRKCHLGSLMRLRKIYPFICKLFCWT